MNKNIKGNPRHVIVLPNAAAKNIDPERRPNTLGNIVKK
jgi:hypothetical protein